MKNKNIVISILIISAIVVAIIINKNRQKNDNSSAIIIGILQTASHPALDAAREGFVDTITKNSNGTINCIVYNAEGSMINAHAIAQRLHADDSIKAIYAIATPALQAIASVEKTKPILIAAVSNPHDLGIIHEKTNICGTTDMIDIPGTIKSIKTILPYVATIALIYNPSESNSVAQITIMDKELRRHSITPLHVGITTEIEVPQAIASALSKADALLAPTDNLVASAMPIISHLAHQAQKPLIASHNDAVKQGALMARGVDYYECGKATAGIALQVLCNGKKPYNLPIAPAKSDTIMINKQLSDELGITIAKISDTIMYINSNK
ncbi:MAG TPA: ABC transporter substrate-binding protein [Candidatus Babeliales bacterium]|jgi:putative ABC transport system substrate-binding protein|nr:ABC transporter substrate-binding protein [Candidatus Babeliales bacterium]